MLDETIYTRKTPVTRHRGFIVFPGGELVNRAVIAAIRLGDIVYETDGPLLEIQQQLAEKIGETPLPDGHRKIVRYPCVIVDFGPHSIVINCDSVETRNLMRDKITRLL